jgi:hypothetical protein
VSDSCGERGRYRASRAKRRLHHATPTRDSLRDWSTSEFVTKCSGVALTNSCLSGCFSKPLYVV